MNKDQINGAAKEAAGKATVRAARAIGSANEAARGRIMQSEGRFQKAYGNVKEALKNSRHS